jgi:hypothetical protein
MALIQPILISDACLGLVESVGDYYPEADWQRTEQLFHQEILAEYDHQTDQQPSSGLRHQPVPLPMSYLE